MLKKEVKNKVGRPKLADNELKKKSLIMSLACAVLVVFLLAGSLVSLNILPKFNKTKGSVPIYKTYGVGDKFCLNGEKECFYTIEDNGDIVTALAEWNLAIDDNGIQNSNYRGYIEGENIQILGGISFANDMYWPNEETYIYNESSNLYSYVQNYQTYLRNELRKTTVTASIMSIEQAKKLCGGEDTTCNPMPTWLEQTSFWLGSSNYNGHVWFVSKGYRINHTDYSINALGVRPVITINKSEIPGAEIEQEQEENIQEENNISDSNTYKVGDEFCLDTECFYTISDNGDTVTGLAKYNLLVGNSYNVTTNELIKIPETTDGYGLQNKESLGFSLDSEVWYGTVGFFSDNISDTNGYWVDASGKLLKDYGTSYPTWVFDENSIIFPMVQQYKNYLKNKGYSSLGMTLPKMNDLVNLGCDFTDDSDNCINAPAWVYDRTYWLGEVDDEKYIYCIATYNKGSYTTYNYNDRVGLRPVITIAKSDLNKKEEVSETKTEDKKTIVNTTTKKEDVKTTTKASKKVVATTKTEEKKEETTTTTTVGSINKVVKKEEVKTSNPIVPIGLGIGSVGAIAGIGYGIYLLKTK